MKGATQAKVVRCLSLASVVAGRMVGLILDRV